MHILLFKHPRQILFLLICRHGLLVARTTAVTMAPFVVLAMTIRLSIVALDATVGTANATEKLHLVAVLGLFVTLLPAPALKLPMRHALGSITASLLSFAENASLPEPDAFASAIAVLLPFIAIREMTLINLGPLFRIIACIVLL